ncbi:hydrolase 2, exosortase A system-associated [Massilia sp. LXY-6]|uniref:hydrolase 2, exosortase A system-associated n=1 Tax=Massilia sp. LXY-6 TaxID=3379823 RepID=UPI003EE30F50
MLHTHPAAEPFFLKATHGDRFCLYHAPRGPCRGALLYVHPFGDEMNRTRRLAAQQARALAERGIGVLLLDLHGCGDSSGDFAEARWATWKDDLALGHAWLHERLGVPTGLWGVRLGALLALDYAAGAATAPARLLLWQPVSSGAAFLSQFLRLRVAGAMLANGAGDGPEGSAGGTRELRARLAAGEALEVGGYEIAPALAAALEGCDTARLAAPGCRIDWFEIRSAPGRPPGPATQRLAEMWRARGVQLHLEQVDAPPFWSTQEIASCPALLAATSALFEEAVDAV